MTDGPGRPPKYKAAFAKQAKKACEAGFTDQELADLFGVDVRTIYEWKQSHPEFSQALSAYKDAADERVQRSFYHRAVGYTYQATKAFMPAGASEPHIVTYTEHVPPDVGACKSWLSNRRPTEWRERQEITGAAGGPLQIVINSDDQSL